MLTEKLRENKTNLSIYLLTLSVIYVFFKFFIDHFLNLMHLYIVTVLLNLINWTYLFLLNKMMSATRIITVCNLLNSNFRTTSSLSALSPWFLYIHFLPVTGLTTCSLGLFRTCFQPMILVGISLIFWILLKKYEESWVLGTIILPTK